MNEAMDRRRLHLLSPTDPATSLSSPVSEFLVAAAVNLLCMIYSLGHQTRPWFTSHTHTLNPSVEPSALYSYTVAYDTVESEPAECESRENSRIGTHFDDSSEQPARGQSRAAKI